MVTFSLLINLIAIATLALGVVGYAFLMMNESQMRIKHDIERNRVLKQKANEGSRGGNIIPERAVDDLNKGRTIM